MNIEEWIDEHTSCIVNMSRIINGVGDESVQSIRPGQEDSCALGKWINGEGRRFKVLLGYRDLAKKHARFHVVATRVLNKIESNDLAGARTAFNDTLTGAAAALLRAIVDLRPEVIGSCCPAHVLDRKSARQKPVRHR